ncbi:MAG: hypothetical protein J7J01_01255 [Methanophagales archaeon]|nr:hypothetical protein [Methanophagales archaeon]
MEEAVEKVDKLLERLLDIIRKSSRVAKRMMELEEEAGRILKNLRDILEKEIKNELEGVAIKRAYYVFYTDNLEVKIDADEYNVNVVISATEPPVEFSEPLTPHSTRSLNTLLTLLGEGEELIKRAEEQVEVWEEESEERAKILKAMKNALAPLILEDI